MIKKNREIQMKDNNNNHSADNIEFEIFSTLRKIIKAVDIYSIRLKENHGINSSQLSCLLALGDFHPISLTSLSKKVSLSPSMMTGIIDQLEKKELAKRVRDSSDRRIILIELTEEGKETIENAPPSFQKKFMEGLDLFNNRKKNEINENLSDLLSLIAYV